MIIKTERAYASSKSCGKERARRYFFSSQTMKKEMLKTGEIKGCPHLVTSERMSSLYKSFGRENDSCINRLPVNKFPITYITFFLVISLSSSSFKPSFKDISLY